MRAAFLDGPVQCGGRGWFCRILEQDDWKHSEGFQDSNFAHCKDEGFGEPDEHDKSGKAGGEGLGAQALASDDELQARKQTPYVLASHP